MVWHITRGLGGEGEGSQGRGTDQRAPAHLAEGCSQTLLWRNPTQSKAAPPSGMIHPYPCALLS